MSEIQITNGTVNHLELVNTVPNIFFFTHLV